MQLHALVDDAAFHFRQPHLRHGAPCVIQFSDSQIVANDIVEKSAAYSELSLDFRELELRILKIPDRLAKGLAILDEIHGLLSR